jgi:hypothetical protein
MNAQSALSRPSPTSPTSPAGIEVALWRIVSSPLLGSALVILLSLLCLAASLIPQGEDARALAANAGAVELRSLMAWGLTDVFNSEWVYGLGALLILNVAAILVSHGAASLDVARPLRAPHRRELLAPEPEHAVEMLRHTFVSRIGSPLSEKVEGERVTMVFDAGAASPLAPLFLHLGLLVLVASAGLHASGERTRVPHVRLKVTQVQTGFSGTFDMVLGEPFRFFGSSDRYVLRHYVADRLGLGPAAVVERVPEGAQEGLRMWIYQRAPKDFDARHRAGELRIEAESMGLGPVPGTGIADSWLNVLMAAGMSLLFLGALFRTGGAGRLWVFVNGDRVELSGVPREAHDADFGARFQRWGLLAESALHPS